MDFAVKSNQLNKQITFSQSVRKRERESPSLSIISSSKAIHCFLCALYQLLSYEEVNDRCYTPRVNSSLVLAHTCNTPGQTLTCGGAFHPLITSPTIYPCPNRPAATGVELQVDHADVINSLYWLSKEKSWLNPPRPPGFSMVSL